MEERKVISMAELEDSMNSKNGLIDIKKTKISPIF